MKKGNYAVIGANGGIGGALTRSLASEGCSVMAGVRSASAADDLARIQGVEVAEIDAKDWDAYGPFFDMMEERLGGIDGVAVCVGSILLKPAHLTSQAEFESVMAINLSSCFAAIRAVAKRMMKSGGSIVLCSSAAARHGFPNHEAIAAAKAGVMGLALSAAATYASYGIRVNCVAPGLVRSKMSQGIVGNEMALKASESMHALGRIGDPEQVARAMAWLLDRDQDWVTGQCFGIDGGLGTLFSKKR